MTKAELEELSDVELLQLGEVKGAEGALLSLNYKREYKQKLEDITATVNLIGEVAVEKDLLGKDGKFTEKGNIAKASLANQKTDVKAANRLNRKYDNFNEDSGASNDMLWGAIWCVGGIAATVADFGYVFWGAIVFGAFQFFRGVANSN